MKLFPAIAAMRHWDAGSARVSDVELGKFILGVTVFTEGVALCLISSFESTSIPFFYR